MKRSVRGKTAYIDRVKVRVLGIYISIAAFINRKSKAVEKDEEVEEEVREIGQLIHTSS